MNITIVFLTAFIATNCVRVVTGGIEEDETKQDDTMQSDSRDIELIPSKTEKPDKLMLVRKDRTKKDDANVKFDESKIRPILKQSKSQQKDDTMQSDSGDIELNPSKTEKPDRLILVRKGRTKKDDVNDKFDKSTIPPIVKQSTSQQNVKHVSFIDHAELILYDLETDNTEIESSKHEESLSSNKPLLNTDKLSSGKNSRNYDDNFFLSSHPPPKTHSSADKFLLTNAANYGAKSLPNKPSYSAQKYLR